MPAVYKFLCHNPRCPSLKRTSPPKQFSWEECPDEPQTQHRFTCPACGTGMDGYLEQIELKRVHAHEMTKWTRPKYSVPVRSVPAKAAA